MAETDVFYCEPRARTGKGGARETRREGWVPGIIYGGGEDPVPVRLKKYEIQKAYLAGRMKAHLAKIDVPGEEGQQTVITRDVQIHPVKGVPLHVDLMRVDAKTRIDVEIPIRFLNEEDSPGLKKGGVLNVVRHTLYVYAPATAIPAIFEIDVTGLEVGDAIHASAVKLPEGVKLVVQDRDFTIATIAAPSALRSADDEDDDDAETPEEIDGEGEAAEVTEEDGGEKKED